VGKRSIAPDITVIGINSLRYCTSPSEPIAKDTNGRYFSSGEQKNSCCCRGSNPCRPVRTQSLQWLSFPSHFILHQSYSTLRSVYSCCAILTISAGLYIALVRQKSMTLTKQQRCSRYLGSSYATLQAIRTPWIEVWNPARGADIFLLSCFLFCGEGGPTMDWSYRETCMRVPEMVLNLRNNSELEQTKCRNSYSYKKYL
jgi:hypothetical protein